MNSGSTSAHTRDACRKATRQSAGITGCGRAFWTVRQELKRYQRKGLGYSKDLETHKAAVALHFGIYNFVRKHHTLGTTPAVAAGIELERWSLERVVDMTRDYLRRKEDSAF